MALATLKKIKGGKITEAEAEYAEGKFTETYKQYVFENWSLDENSNVAAEFPYTIDENTTFTPVCSIPPAVKSATTDDGVSYFNPFSFDAALSLNETEGVSGLDGFSGENTFYLNLGSNWLSAPRIIFGFASTSSGAPNTDLVGYMGDFGVFDVSLCGDSGVVILASNDGHATKYVKVGLYYGSNGYSLYFVLYNANNETLTYSANNDDVRLYYRILD